VIRMYYNDVFEQLNLIQFSMMLQFLGRNGGTPFEWITGRIYP
jgi:hypothetical protein